MTISSQTTNPIQFPQAWDVIYCEGVRSPGVIEQDGIQGFERVTEWDSKKGKGARGATLTLVQQPPGEGSITFLLWLPRHWDEWATYIKLLKYDTYKGVASDAVELFHPALDELNINSAVVSKVSPVKHVGRGMYRRTVTFIEWAQVPRQPVTSTPTKAVENSSGSTPGTPPDPITDALQKAIAAESAKAAKP
jgi:hypothetical protein